MDTQIPLSRGQDLDLTGEFGDALRAIHDSKESFLITGKAGTGKSALLRHFADTTTKRTAVLAPTGIAAVNVEGETIHSFFGFPSEVITKSHVRRSGRRELLESLDSLVVDEVSMVRADLMDGIDRMLRLNRGRPLEPFGGVQMLLFGDIFQLQPVVASDEEAKFFSSYYQSPFFFAAKGFQEARFEAIELTNVFRQKDLRFVELLDAIRMNRLTEAHRALLDSRYRPAGVGDGLLGLVTLTSTNRMAREINRSRLERIRSPASTYEAIWEGDFPRSSFPADPLLTLKTGAQVVFLKNAAGKRWVNGTMGKVVDLDSETVAVEVEQGHGRAVFEVAPDTWESRRYAFSASSNTISGEVVGSFTQIPLRLAWAMTIHKSQGLTFPGVVVDLGGGAFAAGQTYVALSRATSLEGLVLKSRIRESDLIVAEPVMRFYLERVLGASDRRGVLEHKPRGR